MSRTVRILSFLLLLTVIFMTAESSQAKSFSQLLKENTGGGVNIRLRNELWSTFDKEGVSTDRTYDFILARARGHIDVKVENFLFHAAAQGVTAYNLPENSAFGPGGIYFGANGQDDDPGNFHLLEAFVKYSNPSGFYIQGGRIPLKEGTEVLYRDDPKLSWVIKKRLAERLIGTLDWTNAGRRFDGGIAGFQNHTFDLTGFGAFITSGAFDFDDGYESDLDDTVVAGVSFTLKKDVLLSGTQLKIFNYFLYDDRDPSIAFTGDDLLINAVGGNLAGAYEAGPGEIDLMLWFAFQFGDFGTLDHRAFAFITEAGYQLKNVAWTPWLRVGFAYASGDSDPDDSDNGTFYNMVPTNHKWYGYADVNAFSNLADLYFQFFLNPHSRINLSLDGHLFWLASGDEVSIGGSGPFNNAVFGYVYRQPLPGEEIEQFLGGELDFGINIKALDFLSFQVGYSAFIGGDGIEAVFDGEDTLHFFYTQAIVSFNIGN